MRGGYLPSPFCVATGWRRTLGELAQYKRSVKLHRTDLGAMRAMTVSKKHDGNLLASLLWLMLAGCGATLPELKTPLLRGEELVILATRPGVTVRVLLITPNTVPKGIFIYYPGGEGYLVKEGQAKGFTPVCFLSTAL